MKPNTVIGIRTHTWTLEEEKMYQKLLLAFPADKIFVIMNETGGVVPTPDYVNKISWNDEFIRQHQLLHYNHFNAGIGWLCGDYFYYAFREQVKADFYWLTDPDVGLTFDDVRTFFAQTENDHADALLSAFRVLSKEDYWYKSAELVGLVNGNAYGCVFSFNRLSAAAIDRCRQERQKFSAFYQEKGALVFDNNPIGVHFPNDESLVVPTLMREGFSVKGLDELFPGALMNFSCHYWFCMPQHQIMRPRNQVIHPVRPFSRIVARLSEGLAQDIAQSSSWKYTFVDEENTSLVASAIAKNLIPQIEQKLREHYQYIVLFGEFKEMMTHQIGQLSHPFKISTWQGNTLVLDVFYQNKTYALDMLLQGQQLTIKTFERFSGAEWALQFQPYFSDFVLEGNIGRLSCLSIQDMAQCREQLRIALSVFCQQLQ